MIQLRVFSQDLTNEEYLDVSGTDSVQLNMSVAEVQDISSRNSSFSESFRLPMSPRNNRFFESVFDVNISDGAFDVYEKTKCTILEDTIPILEGYLKILSINQLTEEYEVSVFGDTANLMRELGDKKLSALVDDTATDLNDLDHLDHTLSYTNISNSWDGSTTYSVTGRGFTGDEILYPINDYGYGYKVDASTSSITNQNENAIFVGNLRPAIKAKTLWDMIFNHAGYSYESTFIATGTAFDDIYLQCSTHKENGVTVTLWKGFRVRATTQTFVTTAASASIGTVKMDFDTESPAPYHDGDNKYNTTTQTWTIPGEGRYKVKANIDLLFEDPGAGPGIPTSGTLSLKFYLYNNTSGSVVTCKGVDSYRSKTYPYGTGVGEIKDGTARTEPLTWIFDTAVDNVSTGNDIQVYCEYDVGVSTAVTLQQTSYWYTDQLPLTGTLSTVVMQDEVPDMRQADFIKGIIQKFNLILEPSAEDPTHLVIEPYADWINAGTTKDWTNKLDLSKERQILPMHNLHNSALIFQDQEDEDVLNKDYQERFGKRYGMLNQEKLKPMATGEKITESPFSPYLVTLMPGTTKFLYSPIFSKDEKGQAKKIKTKPKLFFYNGKVDVGQTYQFISPGSPPTYNGTSNAPRCSHFSAIPTVSSTIDLSWGFSSPYARNVQVTNPTNNHVYNKYWAKFINEIYNSDARMMTGYFHLTPRDILALKFSDNIWVKDCMYRINKITGYTVGQDSVSKVELIKLLDTNTYDCSVIPDMLNEDGTVDFINPATGGSTSATRACCEDQGFTFLNSDCWWKEPGATETDPTRDIISVDSATLGSGSQSVGGNNLADAVNSFASGDQNDAQSANNSLLAGEGNLAQGSSSRVVNNVTVFGKNAHAMREGEMVQGWGTTSDRSQWSRMTLFVDIPSSTTGWNQIYLDQDSSKHIWMDEGSVVGVVLYMSAFDIAGNQAISTIYHSVLRRAVVGNVTQVSGSNVNSEADGALAGIAIRTSADTTNQAIKVEYNTGGYGNVVSMHVTVELHEYREYL